MERKRIYLLAGMAAALLAVVLVVVLASGGGPARAAEKFLALVGQGKNVEAYNSADLALQAKMDKDKFGRVVTAMKLINFAAVEWNRKEEHGDEARLEGVLTLKDGKTAPVTLSLIRSEGTWRVSSLHNPPEAWAPGFQPAANAVLTEPEPADIHKVPSKPGLRYLSTETLLQFNDAIQAKSFDDFYEHFISQEWKKQITANQLVITYQAFIDNKIDISEIENLTPAFDMEPTVDERGYFIVNGSYPTTPPVIFEITFVYEDDMWKVFHMRVMR